MFFETFVGSAENPANLKQLSLLMAHKANGGGRKNISKKKRMWNPKNVKNCKNEKNWEKLKKNKKTQGKKKKLKKKKVY